MPKGLSSVVRDNLEKCRSAAIAAVDVYSRPGPRFRTAQYIVLIIIAWTALFHAMLNKKGTKPWYQRRKGANPRGDRYEHVGGDPKHWDLSECLRQHFGSENPPERTNLEFLIGRRIGPGTVRLSIGLEDADDLIEDIDQALRAATGS